MSRLDPFVERELVPLVADCAVVERERGRREVGNEVLRVEQVAARAQVRVGEVRREASRVELRPGKLGGEVDAGQVRECREQVCRVLLLNRALIDYVKAVTTWLLIRLRRKETKAGPPPDNRHTTDELEIPRPY